jgi:PPK2 family polyphosphate:nucleotide phosphotransferase
MIKNLDMLAKPGTEISLKKIQTDDTGKYQSKKDAKEKLKADTSRLRELQDKLYAHNRYALLLIFQAMDAAGKDGTIKHVMSGVNPQGCQVFNFKQPSAEELDHDYFWRIYKSLPERGRIGIFNRSYYEEVLIVRVHPELVLKQQLPGITSRKQINQRFWERRYRQINDMERIWYENGTVILKFFLHVSREEQKRRFLARINKPEKNWKFSLEDINERNYWDNYQQAYGEAIGSTSTEIAPWYIIPADHKWYMRTIVGDIIVQTMESLPLQYPRVTQAKRDRILKAKEILENENLE